LGAKAGGFTFGFGLGFGGGRRVCSAAGFGELDSAESGVSLPKP